MDSDKKEENEQLNLDELSDNSSIKPRRHSSHAGIDTLQLQSSGSSAATSSVGGIALGSAASSTVTGTSSASATVSSSKLVNAAPIEQSYAKPPYFNNFSSGPGFVFGGYKSGVHNSSIHLNSDGYNFDKNKNYVNQSFTGSLSETDSSMNASSFLTNDGSISASDKNNLGFTQKNLKDALLIDINRRLGEFSREMIENKKNVFDSKKRITKLGLALEKQSGEIQGFDTSLKNAERKLEVKVKDFETEVVTARNSLLAVIALFASFFTFISISVNIFSKDMSLTTSISVLLVIWSCLISFIFVFMAGISKGGKFFTSASFVKHAIFMVVLFICCFSFPRVIFSIFSIN